ncbi:hypothetical protein FGIG_05113 [Fasciola gigantica]|uniref:Uncharacterized protein n=1 Tax=Fasciola gigantica TaxID=46835 RepID=A0A504YEY5_FASGI|nr:hypothetical protein FGIG_05113 [Fasciola gigantica]
MLRSLSSQLTLFIVIFVAICLHPAMAENFNSCVDKCNRLLSDCLSLCYFDCDADVLCIRGRFHRCMRRCH